MCVTVKKIAEIADVDVFRHTKPYAKVTFPIQPGNIEKCYPFFCDKFRLLVNEFCRLLFPFVASGLFQTLTILSNGHALSSSAGNVRTV